VVCKLILRDILVLETECEICQTSAKVNIGQQQTLIPQSLEHPDEFDDIANGEVSFEPLADLLKASDP
jgi:hypothetical protein